MIWTITVTTCMESDPEIWFVDHDSGAPTNRSARETAAMAISICQQCPLQERCLAEGLRLDRLYGRQAVIYGGKLPAERDAIRKAA